MRPSLFGTRIIRRIGIIPFLLLMLPALVEAHAIRQFFADFADAPFSFQIHRLVLENPTFYEFFRHGRLRYQNGIEQDTLKDYETVETTLSARFMYKGYSLRADLPYQVTSFTDRDVNGIGDEGERKKHHNRGIGDVQVSVEVPIPYLNGWVGLLRKFPTSQTIYDRDLPHLGTGLGVSTWEPSLGYRVSYWIFEAEVEASLISRGSLEVSNTFFGESVEGPTVITFSDFGRGRISLLARLYRDKDQEVTFRGSLIGITTFTETINLTPAVTDPNFGEFRVTNYLGSQASLMELGVRMGSEFKMGIRLLLYPFRLHEGNTSFEQTSMDLSFSFGIP